MVSVKLEFLLSFFIHAQGQDLKLAIFDSAHTSSAVYAPFRAIAQSAGFRPVTYKSIVQLLDEDPQAADLQEYDGIIFNVGIGKIENSMDTGGIQKLHKMPLKMAGFIPEIWQPLMRTDTFILWIAKTI